MLPLAGGVGQPDMLLEEENGGGCGDTRTDGLEVCLGLRMHVWGSRILHLQFNFTETF